MAPAFEFVKVGVGGQGSLFDPQRLVELLAMPAGAEPAAMLCTGPGTRLGAGLADGANLVVSVIT
jgi:hypothetical protein